MSRPRKRRVKKHFLDGSSEKDFFDTYNSIRKKPVRKTQVHTGPKKKRFDWQDEIAND